MNEVIRNIYESKKVQDAAGNDIDAFPVSINLWEGELLYRLVRENNVKRSLETGMALGLSSLHICQALHDGGGGRHTSIDPWQERWFKNVGVLNLQRAGLAGLQRIMYCPSHEGLAEIIREGEPYDFAFIDGNHRFEYVLTDFFLADKILKTGSVLVFHDTWLPSIRKVVTFILRNLDGQYELMPESLSAPPGKAAGMLRAARMALRSSRDIGPALIFGRKAFANTCVFRKVTEPTIESTDLAWDFYRAF